MQTIDNQELVTIKGGATKLVWYAVAALVTLAIGIIDGIINPNKCIAP